MQNVLHKTNNLLILGTPMLFHICKESIVSDLSKFFYFKIDQWSVVICGEVAWSIFIK